MAAKAHVRYAIFNACHHGHNAQSHALRTRGPCIPISNTQAQRSARHGTATPVHVTSPLTVDAAPPVVHSSPFSLSSPPPPPPPSPPLTPVPPWSSTLLMREESCAPSQLDANVPVIVHKLGLYASFRHFVY